MSNVPLRSRILGDLRGVWLCSFLEKQKEGLIRNTSGKGL